MPKFSTDNGVIPVAEALPNIPSEVSRVKILNYAGQEKWRDPKELEADDKIVVQNGALCFMYGKPGRKSTQQAEEDFSPLTEDAEEESRARQSFFDRDSILTKTLKDPGGDNVLEAILKGLAEEQASLAFERKTLERRNGPISQISLRRVNALKTMGELWFKRKEQLQTKEIDLSSEEFASLFRFINETFINAMTRSKLESDTIAVVKGELQALVNEESWVATAKKRMKDLT